MEHKTVHYQTVAIVMNGRSRIITANLVAKGSAASSVSLHGQTLTALRRVLLPLT